MRGALPHIVLGLVVAALGCGRSSGSPAGEQASVAGREAIHVAAAADLARAFDEVGKAYEQKTGDRVAFTFGSTGMLAKQIEEGARYDLFAAANVSFVDQVVKAGACDGATKAPYARGRIVVWAGDEGGLKPQKLEDLADPKYVRIAIANPEHAPYGRAAKEALQKAGLWEKLEPRLVYGENIQQTLQFAQTGNAEAGIVALSLALAGKGGSWALVDDALHAPLDQALVACDRGARKDGATTFAAFVNGAEGRTVMRRYGFVLPGESVSLGPSEPVAAPVATP